MSRYVLTRDANEDLVGIRTFVGATSSKAGASRLVSELRRAMARLADLPRIGHEHPQVGHPYLVWPVRSWLIVYAPDTRPLLIVRVVQGSRDLSQLHLN